MKIVRRPPLAAALVGALLASLVAGWGSESSAGSVESSVERVAVGATEADAGGAVVRHVGATLYPVLAAEAADGNLAYSPASVALAVGMARAGAEGESAAQFDRFLGSADPEELHAALNGLETALAGRSGPRESGSGQEAEITLETANSLWGQSGATWQDPFLDTLKSHYGVGVHTVDYRDDAEGARRAVNDWIADRTRDEITDLIPPDAFTSRTRLTLVNALYLAAPWLDELDPTDPIDFTTISGATVRAEMMRADEERGYQAGDGWQAVTIPYAGEELAMTLLVPDAGRLAEVESQLTSDLLARVLTGSAPRQVVLTMPTFDVESRSALGDALKELGVTAPFATTTDFTPMSLDPDVQPLQLADALHMATITVDEKGTVAAAATAMNFEEIGAMIPDEPPVTLTVDRPFLFVIHDVATAAPLFIGRVADPTIP